MVFNYLKKKKKNTDCRKKFTRSILCSFGFSTATYLFLANTPYFNFQINFQSSQLTKKETEDVSKRLSSYCMGAPQLKNLKNDQICLIRKITEFSKFNNLENNFFYFITIWKINILPFDKIIKFGYSNNL